MLFPKGSATPSTQKQLRTQKNQRGFFEKTETRF